ncbi:MAG: response regulator [Candidatus Ornithospirochaeta sp.]
MKKIKVLGGGCKKCETLLQNTTEAVREARIQASGDFLSSLIDRFLEIAITILEEAGFVVEFALDGIVCVDMMEKRSAGYCGLILMDIQMPSMDGYKAACTIRGLSDPKKAGITIVTMTANAFDEDKKDAYEAWMNRHIAKPIKVGELMPALNIILSKNDNVKEEKL